MSTDIRREMVGHLPKLRAFAYSLTRNRAEADDLVQSACEKALRGAAGFKDGLRVDAWMLRIVHNVWIDTYRRHRREVVVDLSDPIHDRMGEDGQSIVENRSTLQAAQRAIDRLPEDQRSVLVLVCVDGLSYREAADVLDIPVGTVMSRLARARQAVATNLVGTDTQTVPKGQDGRALR